MKRYGYLEISKDTLGKLLNSKELRMYRDKKDAFIEQRKEVTHFVILINENGISFRIDNVPLQEDDTHWEIDRLSVNIDSDTRQEELTFIDSFLKPQIRLYREIYEIGSRIHKNEIDNIEADSAIFIQDQNKSVFIRCYDAASLEVTYAEKIPDDYREIDIKKLFN
ncbi:MULTISPECIES: hypothetical protein [unclassified Sutcliffiella]|uniref:hypothetical protein n=1 Tax=unclassified Sutcliffiella TaxID=2837532 RepID=UPI0030CA90AD